MNPANHEIDEQMLATSSSTNVATANLDTNGQGSYATIRIGLSSGLTTDAVAPTFSLLEADDTAVSSFATIVADKTLAVASSRAMQVYRVDLRGRKRYLRISVTPGTVATDDAVTVNAIATISHMRKGPESTSDMVATTNDSVVVV